jgi:hypothetical protein
VAEEAHLVAKPQLLPHRLDILHHVLDGVAGGIVELLRLPRPALIDEDQTIGSGERTEVRKEIVVRGAWPPVKNQQRTPDAERLVVDQHAVRVDKAVFALQHTSR